MATIQIADDVHPKIGVLFTKSMTQSSHGTNRHDNDDGIYNIRRRSRAPSQDPGRDDEDPGLQNEGDYKHKQVDIPPMLTVCSKLPLTCLRYLAEKCCSGSRTSP